MGLLGGGGPGRVGLAPWVFLIVLPGVWLLAITLVDVLSGRPRLLKAHPPQPEDAVQWFHFATGKLGLSQFNNALTVGVGVAGLHLAPMLLFRAPFWRGIPCLPWAHLERLPEPRGFWGRLSVGWGPSLSLRVKSQDLKILLVGRVAEAALAGWEAQTGQGPIPPQGPVPLTPR